jgi:hypothetical protein
MHYDALVKVESRLSVKVPNARREPMTLGKRIPEHFSELRAPERPDCATVASR